MDKFGIDFLKVQKIQLFAWFRCIGDVFFIWTHGKAELESFMKELNILSDHIKFTFASNRESISFLDVNINLSNGHFIKNIY